jgi:hypothetical protein
MIHNNVNVLTNRHHLISGYHWQMDGRSQESQEAAGQHRDAQGKPQFSFVLLRMQFLRKKCKKYFNDDIIDDRST